MKGGGGEGRLHLHKLPEMFRIHAETPSEATDSGNEIRKVDCEVR